MILPDYIYKLKKEKAFLAAHRNISPNCDETERQIALSLVDVSWAFPILTIGYIL